MLTNNKSVTFFTVPFFNITVAQVETIVQPNGVGNNVGRESVTLYAFIGRFYQLLPVNLAIPSRGLWNITTHDCPSICPILPVGFMLNTSSLDLAVITDFHGDAAQRHNRLRRSIQRWCVETRTKYSWGNHLRR
jgi:hypothetical protein